MQGRNSRTILQERCLDRLGGLLIYSPISFEAIINVINGGDISLQPILPSGLVISGDSRQSSTSSDASSVGSILTVALQILVADIPPAELSSGNVRDYGRALMDKTVNKIKANTLHLVIWMNLVAAVALNAKFSLLLYKHIFPTFSCIDIFMVEPDNVVA